MTLAHYRMALWMVLVCTCPFAMGQEVSPDASKGTQPAVASVAAQDQGSIEQVPRVPGIGAPFRSFNAGLTFSALHDDYSGWYTVITPAASYTYTQHFSADLSISSYIDRQVQTVAPGPPGQPETVTNARKSDLGDLMLGAHGVFGSDPWRNMATFSLTMPTGSQTDGLSTGSVTVDFSNRLERSFGPAGLQVDVGLGNSAGLFNSLVSKQYNSLGPLSHYQAGLSLWLPGSVYLQSMAYEQLPFGRQTVYNTERAPGSSTSTTTTTSFSADDHGLTTFVSVPLQEHILLSGYYNRSLRENLNTVSIGTTFVLHKMQKRNRMSLADRALIEAETGGQ